MQLKKNIINAYYILLALTPQNLRNIIKKVAKIGITQIIMELVCQNNCILLFFWYLTNFTGLG